MNTKSTTALVLITILIWTIHIIGRRAFDEVQLIILAIKLITTSPHKSLSLESLSPDKDTTTMSIIIIMMIIKILQTTTLWLTLRWNPDLATLKEEELLRELQCITPICSRDRETMDLFPHSKSMTLLTFKPPTTMLRITSPPTGMESLERGLFRTCIAMVMRHLWLELGPKECLCTVSNITI